MNISPFTLACLLLPSLRRSWLGTHVSETLLVQLLTFLGDTISHKLPLPLAFTMFTPPLLNVEA